MPQPRFLIIDRHPLMRLALRDLVHATFADSQICEARSPGDLVEREAGRFEPTTIILDLKPSLKEYLGLLRTRSLYKRAAVVVAPDTEDRNVIRRSLVLGAAGVLPKTLSADKFGRALEAIVSGGRWLPSLGSRHVVAFEPDQLGAQIAALTTQQLRIFALLCEGLSTKAISMQLGISEGTVKTHVCSVLRKLELRRRTQAAAVFAKNFSGEMNEAARFLK